DRLGSAVRGVELRDGADDLSEPYPPGHSLVRRRTNMELSPRKCAEHRARQTAALSGAPLFRRARAHRASCERLPSRLWPSGGTGKIERNVRRGLAGIFAFIRGISENLHSL